MKSELETKQNKKHYYIIPNKKCKDKVSKRRKTSSSESQSDYLSAP